MRLRSCACVRARAFVRARSFLCVCACARTPRTRTHLAHAHSYAPCMLTFPHTHTLTHEHTQTHTQHRHTRSFRCDQLWSSHACARFCTIVIAFSDLVDALHVSVGAPCMPAEMLLGSISHTDGLAVAVAATAQRDWQRRCAIAQQIYSAPL
eukprot:568272-Pleurochrysis_carterae.AAC.2